MMKAYNHRQRDKQIDMSNKHSVVDMPEVLLNKQSEFPMFYLVDCQDFVAMYMADEFAECTSSVRAQDLPVLMVYRQRGEGLLLDPEEVYRRKLQDAQGGENLLACLEFMLAKMKAYRGVPSDKSVLYAEEMLFRFNCRENDSAWGSIASATEQPGGETLN